MDEKRVLGIADSANMIVRGFAFERKDNNITVVNLNRPDDVLILNEDGVMIETNMDPIEQAIVLEIWKKDVHYLEEEDAEVFSA